MAEHFTYKAMDNQGSIVQGQIDANNSNDLELRLEKMGLDLINYQTKKPHSFHVGKVTHKELITFCFHMEQLVRSGVPLLEGLEDLRGTLKPCHFRDVVSSLIENIEGGKNLSDAMRNFPNVFDNIFISLIRAGEESGQLNMVFEHLTETLKWHDEITSQVKKALLYPAFMGIVIIGVIFFIMTYLVPKLVTFIQSVQQELPLHTKILLYISNTFVEYWGYILLTPILLIILIKTAISMSTSIRFQFDHLKLRIWVIGPIIEKMMLARFSKFFGLLYGAGITVLDSLDIVKNSAGNTFAEASFQRVRDQIADGMSISESFERVHLFPPLVLRMVKVGESTGELDIALSNVTYFYTRDVKESIERLKALIEPTLTVILGGLLGAVMISVLGPIYDIVTKFSY